MSVHAEFVLQVNRQLAFVRVQLQAVQVHLQQNDIQSRLSVHAHLDAAMKQLDRAMVLFALEVGDHVGVFLPERQDCFEALLKQISHLDMAVPEFNEWLQLLKQQDSWLSQYFRATSDPHFFTEQFIDSTAGIDESENVGVNDSHNPSEILAVLKSLDPLPSELLQQWLHYLQALIDRQRENLVEA